MDKNQGIIADTNLQNGSLVLAVVTAVLSHFIHFLPTLKNEQTQMTGLDDRNMIPSIYLKEFLAFGSESLLSS